MDLTLSFSSPERQTPKLELSFPGFQGNSYNSNVLPIHLPMESVTSNSMFETSGGCRITRWVVPNYNSNCSYMQKSLNFNKGNTSLQKVMVPKIPSIALSVSQQTLVGGFVGSKSHAGRSFFGDSSQVWDAVICKFVELMSLAKEKTSEGIPESKLPFSNIKSSKICNPCVSGVNNLNADFPKENIISCASDSNLSSSNSKMCKPDFSNMSSVVDRTSKNSLQCALPDIYNPVYSVTHEQTIEKYKATLPSSQRETYSSVVDRTFRNNTRCTRPETCTTVKSVTQEQTLENSKASLPSFPRQSYAEVAKTIPHKSLECQKKVGCEMIQNFKKKIWSCKSGRGKREHRNNQAKKVIEHANLSKIPPMDDFVSSGDTRWRADRKSKRTNFQKSHPVTVPTKLDGSLDNETIGKIAAEDGYTKDSDLNIESESVRHKGGSEAVKTDRLKEGLRGRYPSECSLDSDDSFVVFEDCPDSAGTTSLEQNSSLEEDEEFADDDSISSSDDSDSEDDCMDNGQALDCNPMTSSKLQKANCEWRKEFCVYTVPESISKVLPKKKVRFAEGCRLAVVRPMIAWGYAYRESRRGPWEIHARDRARFHCRIDSVAPLLNLVLDPHHRKRILESRFSGD